MTSIPSPYGRWMLSRKRALQLRSDCDEPDSDSIRLARGSSGARDLGQGQDGSSERGTSAAHVS